MINKLLVCIVKDEYLEKNFNIEIHKHAVSVHPCQQTFNNVSRL